MFLANAIFLFYFIDTLYAEASIDINRVHKINVAENMPFESHIRHSVSREHLPAKYINKSPRISSKRTFRKTGRYSNQIPLTKESSTNIHQPREDPRLFYQSDSYLQETNVNYEVASIYPGGHITNANKHINNNPRSSRLTNGDKEQLRDSVCVKCPHDRTLVAKTGSDRVLFMKPQLAACSVDTPMSNIRFELIYGPQFGTLLGKGTHVVVGRIYDEDRDLPLLLNSSLEGRGLLNLDKHIPLDNTARIRLPLQLCKMQVHVITQNCPVPSYLIKHCNDGDDEKKQCRFSCRSAKWQLHGPSRLSCENNRRWSGRLPVCKVRTSCEELLPPNHGWISCKGTTKVNGTVFQEGSKCRVKCARGWRRSSHTTICRRGAWTKNLSCY